MREETENSSPFTLNMQTPSPARSVKNYRCESPRRALLQSVSTLCLRQWFQRDIREGGLVQRPDPRPPVLLHIQEKNISGTMQMFIISIVGFLCLAL